MRTRFKYLLKFELFPPQPLLGGLREGQAGEEGTGLSLQPNHILFAHSKGMLYPEEKACAIEKR